ncbi:MAG TPA: FtsX-like permease family protein, partial [Streptosporangiaceae bacterium]
GPHAAARLPVTLAAGGHSYYTALIALRPVTVMHTFLTPAGHARPLPQDGVLLGPALRHTLGVDAGDRIPLRLPAGAGQAAAEGRVAGFVAEPLGTYAYASLGYLRTLAPELSGRPGVLTYSDARALRQAVNTYMRLFYVFVAVMLVFGGLLAFTVLFATMSVNLAERDVEVATLRAFGVARRRLSWLITTENPAGDRRGDRARARSRTPRHGGVPRRVQQRSARLPHGHPPGHVRLVGRRHRGRRAARPAAGPARPWPARPGPRRPRTRRLSPPPPTRRHPAPGAMTAGQIRTEIFPTGPNRTRSAG